MIEYDLVQDALHTIDFEGELGVGECPKRLLPNLRAIGLPRWLSGLLESDWVNRAGDFPSGHHIHSVEEILTDDDLEQYLKCNLLPIGSALNGDPIVLLFGDEHAEVGMISHEEVYQASSLSEVYHRVTSSLEEYLIRNIDRMYLPIDSYAARDFTNLSGRMHCEGCRCSERLLERHRKNP